VEGEVT
jgi:hypothetical protein